uniref:Genome polyprotein n=1 Tax=Bat picornavirus 7 TaxID=3038998 RepID=A0AAT9TYN7_9PICO|nr:MAG: polyprotein [Bat picornavirus 7]
MRKSGMGPTTLECPCFYFILYVVYGDNMPVKTPKVCFAAAIFYSKDRVHGALSIVRQTWMCSLMGSKLLKQTVVLNPNKEKKTKAVRNCGLSASKSASGNTQHRVEAGGNVTQINYYGAHYAAASANSAAQLDPERFTKPIQALVDAGPALKSPTVEECGYSDRILQITSGNSTITTQEAAGAVVAYGVWPEYDEGVGEAIDAQTRPGPAAERFYTMNSVAWTSQWPGYFYRFPSCISDLGIFGQNCMYHYLMRSGFCVHIQLNASKFHQGLLLAVLVPEFQQLNLPGKWHSYGELSTAMTTPIGLHQLTVYPHQFINIRSNNSATIIWPYTNAVPAENPLTHNPVALLLIPITRLEYSAGATTHVPITVSFAPMATQFSGLRTSVPILKSVTQGVPTFQVPGSGQFMTTLANSGYPALPQFQETIPHKIPGEVHNLLEVAQVDTICDASLATDGSMSFYLDVSQQTSNGGHIASWDLSLNSKLMAPTYLSRLARWYTHYRGSIQITFMYTGSSMSTGKLLLAYTPPGASGPPTNRTDAMLATHVIWDVGLQSSCTLTVPYISQTLYRYNNISGNTFSYDGWVSMFYQTNIVVPPGAPTTTHIVILVSAAKDFTFRLATDSAFYQGIGDKLGEAIQSSVQTSLQNALQMPVTDNTQTVPQTLSIMPGDAATLTAPETGASASAEAGQVMETRLLSTTISGMETDVNCFMSRYALFYKMTLTAGEPNFPVGQDPTSWRVLPLYFSADDTTHKALIAKYRMFTYLRCGYDIVIVSSIPGGQQALGQPIKFQVMYIPPGAPRPTQLTSPEWYVPTTPSLYGNAGDVPASFRIPFVGLASAYATRYDGFEDFNPELAKYGHFPGNYIGQLAIRLLTLEPSHTATDISHMKVDFLCYARPTQIKAYVPRPIIPLKTSSRITESTGRVETLAGEPGEGDRVYDTGDMNFPQGIIKNTGRKGKLPRCYKRTILVATKTQMDCLRKMPLFRNSNGSFHCFRIKPLHYGIPRHLHEDDLYFAKWKGEMFEYIPHTVVQHCTAYDLSIIRLEKDIIEEDTPLCFQCHPGADWCDQKEAWTACNSDLFSYLQNVGPLRHVTEIDIDEPIEHKQYGLWEANTPIPAGFCGSPLMCKHGVIGIATASDEENLGWWTDVGKMPRVKQMRDEERRRRERESRKAEEQGPLDWLGGVAQQLGGAFGGGVLESVRKDVNDLYNRMNYTSPEIEIGKEVLNLLVKCICTCVLISKAEDKASTAATLGVMLGVDLLLHSPFDWLKVQVNKFIGAVADKFADVQGPSDWIKEFNAACTAAKGLEWIAQQITKFLEWIKAFFETENPKRRKFMEMLSELPTLMEHLDKIAAARGKYARDTVLRVCNKFKDLKAAADVYGVERNQATTQIVKYYNKAMGILQTMTQGRTEPVAIMIHGTPGTGKSLATEVMGRCITNIMGGSRPYSLPPDPKHFDGYAQQHVVIMDDVGQNPDGEDLKLFCQMVSSTEFIVPMASLEEKGMPFTSDFVFASTNAAALRPPTVSEPRALERRFFCDFDIEVKKEYQLGQKLNADAALTPCQHTAHNFKKCCPLICGKALSLVCRRTGVRYSIDEAVTKVWREHEARKACGNKLEAIFQGPGDEWYAKEFVKEPTTLLTIDEQKTVKNLEKTPAPKEVADLLRAVPSPEVISYCERRGWLIPADANIKLTRECVATWVKQLSYGLSILSSVLAVGGFIFMLYRVFAGAQGAYCGAPMPVLRKPELRRVAKVQGPDLEFAQKLMKHNVFDVKTLKGHFSGLAVFGKWMILPKHSMPGNTIELEGQEVEIEDIVDLENMQGSLELTGIKLKRPVDFKDIRKYFPDHFTAEKDCQLVINNENYRRLFCPVGTVTSFGFLNLSGRPTYNTCTYRYPTRSGQCGGVICKAGKVIALHIGGDGLNGYGAILTKKMFVMEQGQITTMEKSKTPINLATKTKLHPSVFHEIFPGTKEPAALRPSDPRLEVDLETALFSKYKGNADVEMDEYLDEAVDHYANQLSPILPTNLTEPLTLEEVVYGIEHLDGLDLATSAGYPYVTKGIRKKDLIPPRGEPLTKLQQALDLHGFDLPYVTYLKDELRPKEKIKNGKTRLIECSSLNDTIRMKRTFGRLFQAFHQNPGTVSGSAVGCNPDFHWSRFYAEMGGLPLIAFDYSNYDASLSPIWFEALKKLLGKLGYTEEQVKVIEHVQNSTHLYKDKKYTVEGGMPSGCSGTSIFNSIINNLIIRTMILRVYKGVELDSLKMIAYGDDVIASYPFPLDASLLAEEGKIYGLTMTPPDKTADFNETNWENVTFLKRKFVPDKTYPFLIHPVFNEQEIFESIRWTRSAAATEEHVRSLCYLHWHSGEESYNSFLSKIRQTAVGKALSLPAFTVLRQQWYDLF